MHIQNASFNSMPQTSGYVNMPAPAQPTLQGSMAELIGYLHELQDLQSSIRSKIVGPEPCAQNSPQPLVDGIENQARYACERAALTVGDAKSLLARL